MEGMVARHPRPLNTAPRARCENSKQLEHPPYALAEKRVFDHRSDAATRTFLPHDNEKSR